MPRNEKNGGRGSNGRRGESLSGRLDRAVELRDRELGIGAGMRASGTGAASPEAAIRDRMLNPPSAVPPPVPPPGPHRASSSTFGVPGTPIVSGFLEDLGEYNGELAGRNALRIYEKMRRGDAQVRATLAACKLPVQSARWEVVAQNVSRPLSAACSASQRTEDNGQRTASTGAGRNTQAKANEIAGFIRENLFGGLEFRTSTGGWATQSWDEVVRNALLMLDFGCAVHEDVWTVDGDKVRLRKLAARLPITFYRWHTEADGETLLALEQYGYRRAQYMNVLLPAEKCTVFTYQQEGANFWGMALQRPMYPHWYVKSQLYRIDAIACERNSLGVPVFKLAPGFSKEDRDAAYSFVTQLAAHEATGMVEPPGDANSGLRIVGYEGRVREVAPSIEHHNVMISRAALAMFMDLGQAEHGSRALGQEHGDFFLLALQNLADQIALQISNTSIRRLVSFNFGGDAPVPKLVAANVQSRGLADIVGSLTQLAQVGLVVSEDNLRSFIRSELALPAEGKQGVVAVRGETVDEPGGAVSGKGAAGIE